MQEQWSLAQSSRATLAALVLLVGGVLAACPAPSVAAEPSVPKPLPKEIVQAWQEAGAKVGWMDRFGFREDRSQADGHADVFPAFRIRTWKDGIVSPLPAPGVPFALDLSDTRIKETGLMELATLNNLRSLDLEGTRLTDASLEKLTGLKRLESLNISRTQWTRV